MPARSYGFPNFKLTILFTTRSDIWPPGKRGRAIGLYNLAPVLGPVLGPIAAGWIAERTTWRWVFWSTSIAACLIQLCGLVWLRETYAPFLLQQKRTRLVQETGNNTALHLSAPTGTKPPLGVALGAALVRPTRMLATQPVWTGVYGEPVSVGGLNYLSFGLGTLLGTALALRFGIRDYERRKEANGGAGCPEWRLPLLFLGAAVTPVGLLWFGWGVQARTHWTVPNLGIVVFTAGTVLCLQGMHGYMLDTYAGSFAASGMAATVVLRSLCGFAFPLFAPGLLYGRLGCGWGASVLALVSVGVGIPAPLVFWRWGERLRRASRYATA